MNTLAINERKLYYALCEGRTMTKDKSGYYTGDSDVTYSDPVEFWANVSAARGEASTEQFGQDVSYDKVIVSCDVNLPITDTSIIWIENSPTEQHDYIVKKVAKSLNVVSIAVRKVEVTRNQ